MNFAGKFDAKLPFDDPDIHSGRHFNVDSFSAHAPADAIVVPDVHLLFGGDYKRSGVDLILSDSDHELVLQDYFKGEKRAALAAPGGGAHLSGDVVNALAGGHVEYAQAGGATAAAAVVGHVTKLVGSATAIRNGVSIVLAAGDNVEKGDVLQSGSASTLGVTFIDGTVFGLSSNARMVVNELVYDPNGSNNSSLLSLVQGTISFVAGETAKHGDMKVDTPVATMGIRGTAVLVQIDFDTPGGTPDAKFQVLVEPDGHTGSYILYDKTTLDPIATVNQAGHQVNISHGVVTYSTNGLSPELQKLITDVFALKFTDNTNPNTKSLDHFTDSIVPLTFTPFKFTNVSNLTPIVFTVNITNGPVQSSSGPLIQIEHIPIAPKVSAQDGFEAERIGVTGDPVLDSVSGKVGFFDINLADRPTAAVVFETVSYQTTQHQDVTSLLSPQQLAAIGSAMSISQDPGNTNQGTATWTYSISDDAFDFLGAGETLTLTYLVKVSNNYPPAIQVTTVPITITITGTNDVPAFTSSVPKTIAFSSGTSVPGGDLIAKVPTSGTLSFADPDLTDTHKVSVALVDATLDGSQVTLPPTPLKILESALSVSIGNDSTDTGSGTIDWALSGLPAYLGDFVPKGETLTLTYAVTVTDSQGATATEDITVTITGTDTPAVVWIATTAQGAPSGGLWSDPSNWETGTVPTANDEVIIITDQLRGLTPSYPVTIDAPAVANSLTTNDFGTSPPELINRNTLDVGGAFTMSADSIVENYGTITVGGLMAIGDHSVLDNFGTLTLEDGGAFGDQSTVWNAAGGTIEVRGGTLAVEVHVDNAGSISIGASGTLELENATIVGGTLDNSGTVDVEGPSGATLDGITVTGPGSIEVDAPEASATTLVLQNDATMTGGKLAIGSVGALGVKGEGGATLKGVSITNDNSIEIFAASLLTLAAGTTLANKGTIIVDSRAILALNDASITGGTIADHGIVHVTGDSAISGADLIGGHVTVDADQVLTLDNVTVSYAHVDDASSIIEIDGGDTLTLYHATISGGMVNDYSVISGNIVDGYLDIAGSSRIRDAALNHGHVTIESGQTLTLDDVTATGTTFDDTAKGATIQVDSGHKLTLNGVTIDGGTLAISGSLEIAGPSTIDDAVMNNASITVDSGQKLTLHDVDAAGSTITLAGTNDTLNLDSTFHGAVTGWSSGDTINLTDLAYSASETAVWNGIEHTLTISNGAQTEVLQLEGDYTQNDFALAQDAGGHTELLWNDVPATLAVLNNHGDSVVGNTLTASLNDPDATGITYTWLEDGKVVSGQASSSFTPTSVDLGKTIDVVIGFTDHGVTEQLTETAGAVVAAPTVCETNPPAKTVILARLPNELDGANTHSHGLHTDIALTNPDTVAFDGVTSDGGSDVLHWTYDPGHANFDFLKPGDTLTLMFDAEIHEGAVKGTPGDDTFVNIGGGVKIFGGGGHDTFVFNEHFGGATVADFNVNQDSIDLSHTLFASVSDILANAHPADFGHDTVIMDAAHDHMTLSGVTVAQLQAHANDFHLV